MKAYYEKRIAEYTKAAQDLELKAEREMREGSGAQAMEYRKQDDINKAEATKYREALEMLEKVA